MKYFALILLLCAVGCANPDDDPNYYVLRYSVQTTGPATITVIGDEQGLSTTFDHPGGLWGYELEIDPPVPYKMNITTTVAQTLSAFVVIQTNYDEIYMLNIGTRSLLAGESMTYEGWTPTASFLKE